MPLPDEVVPPEQWVEAAGLAGLFFLTFLSEDAATFAAALLCAAGQLQWHQAFWVCFFGIWVGDVGLYALTRAFGRPLLDRFWGRNPAIQSKIEQSEAWFARCGIWPLIICRFIPGSRLPVFIAAGLLRMPWVRFTLITGVLGAGWVALVFVLVHQFGRSAERFIHIPPMQQIAIAASLLAAAALAWVFYRVSRDAFGQGRSWARWEFWPAWLFYMPVALNYLLLAARYRGLRTPMASNPGMFTGGMIGESKYATLAELQAACPDETAASRLLPPASLDERMSLLRTFLASASGNYPIVLKPDVAQRGSGFRVVRSENAAREYLSRVGVATVAQEYIPGPFEAGIFYYRHPGEARGRIFAITEKIFPVVSGDGRRTIEQLIRADERSAMLAATYAARFGSGKTRVLAEGETLRLVEAGNHAQGCIFRDGMHLWTDELERKIDAISQALTGFFVGRYDVRFGALADFQRGSGFKILELNGASSEATSAYDGSKSLRQAYALLFEQWRIVFAIGAANRSAGFEPASFSTLWKAWRAYARDSRCHPLAD